MSRIPSHLAPLGGWLRGLRDSYFNRFAGRPPADVPQLETGLVSGDQEFLTSVLRQIPVGLLVLDPGGVVSGANRAAERLLDIPAGALVGKRAAGILLDYEFATALDQLYATGARAERTHRLAGGRILRVRIGPLSRSGAVSGALVVLEDVTALERTDAMRRDFVANVSHELRTPVTSIRAMTETIQLRGSAKPELLQEYTARIVTECERMQRLVDDLLLLAQTEAGQLSLQIEALAVDVALEEVAAPLQPMAERAGCLLTLQPAPGLLVRADRQALAQCLRNLVENAIRYAPGSQITMQAEDRGATVRLYVRDTGPGIGPEHLDRIWERFYQVHRHRSRAGGGSGLGLSLVRRLMEAQGGRTGVQSRTGEGSSFWLELPGDGRAEETSPAATSVDPADRQARESG